MTTALRIPTDVEVHDRIVGSLTARQLVLLGSAALGLYLLWIASRGWLPPAAFLVLAVLMAAAAIAVVLGRRDGVSLDRLLGFAVAHRFAPRRYLRSPAAIHPVPDWVARQATPTAGAAPGGGRIADGLPLPARAVEPGGGAGGPGREVGVVDLGADGLAVLAAVSTVNLAMRTPAEQDSLVAVLARYLHALGAPVQILVRAHRVELGGPIATLRAQADALPDRTLADAADAHADYLGDLARYNTLLQRQVLLVLREPTPAAGYSATNRVGTPTGRGTGGDRRRPAATTRLVRRLGEASALLGPAGLIVTALSRPQAHAVLVDACEPDRALSLTAGPDRLTDPDTIVTRTPQPRHASENPGTHGHPRAAEVGDDAARTQPLPPVAPAVVRPVGRAAGSQVGPRAGTGMGWTVAGGRR